METTISKATTSNKVLLATTWNKVLLLVII